MPPHLQYWIRSTWDGERPADGAEIKLTISSSVSYLPRPQEEANKMTDDENNHNALTPSSIPGLIIHVDAPFYGDPKVPENIPKGSMDQLWDYEVVELFFLASDNKYLEIELSPSGHYLLLQLDGSPQRRLQFGLPLPFYTYQVQGDRWTAQAFIPWSYLPSAEIVRFNAYAIHKSDPNRVYMALYPAPKGKYEGPNFHRLEYFQPIDLSPLLQPPPPTPAETMDEAHQSGGVDADRAEV